MIPKKQIHSFHCPARNHCWIPIALWVNAEPFSTTFVALDIWSPTTPLATSIIPLHIIDPSHTSLLPNLQIHRTFHTSLRLFLALPGLLYVQHFFYLKNFSFCMPQIQYLYSSSSKRVSHLSFYFHNNLRELVTFYCNYHYVSVSTARL